MVYSKPSASNGAMKRSASVMHEGAPGWDVPPPMISSSRSAMRLPYAHYAMIYLDNEGKLKVDESASIQEQNTSIFTPEVRQSFLEILGEKIGYHPATRPGILEASPRRVKPRRSGNLRSPIVNDNRLADHGSDSDDYGTNNSTEMVALRIGDTQKVMAYYEGALKHFQQLNCRMVAKAFIKFIEPRKQVRHPYNGGKPPPGSAPGTTGDPEKTKPEWWPPMVMHKEPDHLRKEYRIELLLHIIRKLGSYGITADKLKEVAGDTKRSLKHPSHVDIIYEILRVRKMEERFERGEVDSGMAVYVMNRGPSPKGDGEEDDDSNDASADVSEHIEEGLMTPTSSVEQAVTSMTPMNLPVSSVHSMSTYSIAEPIGFDATRQDRPYYATPPHYAESFSSQSMLNTPVPAEIISPHEVTVFDYSSQNSYPTSAEQQRNPNVQYDSWAPTFRPQHIYGPVDYSTPPTSQPLPQPSMQYHMHLASTHLQDMSHHHHSQSPMDSQRALPFRNGSLSHPHGLPISHPA
ncbi:hypothetical protein N7495_006219 [Penicillium taxi]|uniref:uncharacterized protein n=1 Tax=Penicillium taxi TaxID=168475 RepID=UPI00254578F4|nr:uncharacterized protein N7495_006219 [Penicillium taxi]KAJ5894528.1 hypothetical protein N7495_006219 [Penicillium taxi]